MPQPLSSGDGAATFYSVDRAQGDRGQQVDLRFNRFFACNELLAQAFDSACERSNGSGYVGRFVRLGETLGSP